VLQITICFGDVSNRQNRSCLQATDKQKKARTTEGSDSAADPAEPRCNAEAQAGNRLRDIPRGRSEPRAREIDLTVGGRAGHEICLPNRSRRQRVREGEGRDRGGGALRSAARRERADASLRRARPRRRTGAGRRARSLRARERYSQAPPPPCSACSSSLSSRASSSAAVAVAVAAAMGTRRSGGWLTRRPASGDSTGLDRIGSGGLCFRFCDAPSCFVISVFVYLIWGASSWSGFEYPRTI
jgi:hypothetical protein